MIKLNSKSKVSANLVGGKGLNLIKLSNKGFKVPEGFVVGTDYFERESKTIRDKLTKLLEQVSDDNVQSASDQIKELFENLKLSDDFTDTLTKEFKNLNCDRVAVRSSAANEDGADASWAGQLSTELNVSEDNLIEALKTCWASAYGVRALQYAKNNNFSLLDISVAVVIQRMIQSDVSGVAFSVNPVTQDSNEILIEAVYGLGEAIVSGSVTPDEYIIGSSDFNLIEANYEHQDKKLSLSEEGTSWVDVEADLTNEPKLKGDQVVELAKAIKDISSQMGYEADVEWAIEDDILYITQSRPITTLG
jgi:phosphoenolpyruvate synthase/pyruvate phosphate dikinase